MGESDNQTETKTSKASSWWRKLKQVNYLEDTKNNFIMDESDNQRETKTPLNPRHPVGGEN